MIESFADQVKESLMEENLAWIKKWLSSNRGLQPSMHKALKQLVSQYENQDNIIKGLRKTNETLLQAKSNLEYTLVRVGKDLTNERERHDASRWKLKEAEDAKQKFAPDVPLGKCPSAPSASETMSEPHNSKPVKIPRMEIGDRVTIYYVADTLECILVHRPQKT